MRISEMLTAIASWLESPNNEAILLAEYDEECLNIVANSCVQAAALLKVTAEVVEDIEPLQESKITPELIDDLAAIAEAFDKSEDENLKKQASVIDELLLTIASPPDAVKKRMDEIEKKYKLPSKSLEETNKIADSVKAIEKSNMTDKVDILQYSLSTRYCPDHPGTQISRVGDNLWQCELDKKTYNFESGFTLNNGKKVPGGDVANQTTTLDVPYYTIFDNREDRLNSK